MLFSRCKRSLMRAVVATVALSVLGAPGAMAKPRPGAPGFRLLSSALAVFQTNRVQCRVGSDGEICATGSSTVGGGLWPKGTADQYVFASGIQIAGIIDATDSKSINGFAGDTAGAMFYNTSTGSGNGVEVRPIFTSSDPNDAAAWPDAGLVPQGDVSEDLFDPTLRGKIAASQGDNWFISWEGDPSNLTFRTHPLGIAVETRSLAWNFPSGNEDILYFIYTFYNVTSANDADYAAIRPSLQPIIAQLGKNFQALNSAKYGIAIPAGGYTIKNLFVDFVADMDVAQADANFASVNVPFALGYTYEHSFNEANAKSIGWTFDPAIFGSAPFFNGPGFVGVKYLRSPINPATGLEVGLSLFGTFSRSSGSLQDPNDDRQLYRYISGGLLPTDGACSVANPSVNHICFVNIGSSADMRFFESSGPFDLGPGQFGSVVVAYIFAPPMAAGGCPGAGCADVKPATSNANLTILGSASRMASGVNKIDTITGYLGFNDGNADGVVTQEEFVVQRGSLLGKALVAQSVFDHKFLLPFAPERPDFFLVPGDNQVTVLWAKSLTESVPDPFFAVASSPTSTITNPDNSTSVVVNPLYDPNFRGLDVEGYRVYRGRTSNPSELTLVAQFDYAPDPQGRGVFQDFRATMNPVPGCAPELGVITDCAITFSTPAPGTPFIGSVGVDLVGTVTQVIPGDRVLLANGAAQTLPGKLDSAFVDIARGRLAQGVTTELRNTGVPFLFVDHGVRNSLRYFYAVTAFDVNSSSSGPSSLESARTTKAVTPVRSAVNATSTAAAVKSVADRDGAPLTDSPVPTLDAATGKFSGPFPGFSTESFDLNFATLVADVAAGSNTFKVRLDSLTLGQSGNGALFGNSPTTPNLYFYTAQAGTPDAFVFSTSTLQTAGGVALGGTADTASGVGFFEAAAPVSPAVASRFEAGGSTFKLSGKMTTILPSNVYLSGQGQGCAFVDAGFGDGSGCSYNGARWFNGPSPANNETQDHPNAGNSLLSGAPLADYNNAGALTGVTVIHEPHAYTTFNREWRNVDWALGGAVRAADFNVYWGAAGLVDSVVDVSNNVQVPFDTTMGGNFGILTTANSGAAGSFDARPTVLTVTDLGCVFPLIGLSGVQGRIPCTATTPYNLSRTATLGTIAFNSDSIVYAQSATLAPPAPESGFLFYLPGHVFLMQMPALPAQGTVWAMRSYVGAINGGIGAAGDAGPYAFTPAIRPFTAVGALAQVTISASTGTATVAQGDLSHVHTVPDPYYVQSKFEASTDQKILKFVGLPQDAIIRIYSASGVLVRMLEHHGGNYSSTSISQGSEIDWDLRNRNNQVVASGVYFYHVEAGDARKVGRFTVVNFAQ
jgi:hypothetical protein